MRPPLPTGTVLQNRYRILSVLGQGGFGRTYLTEDQGRFNELCAMKELTPTDGGEYALEKSKELFLREGQTLYQIQHPQIPQFRATFEYEQRLFLVQDYVEGPTYRDLLDQRRSQGYAFSEPEVRQLMLQLLPVLAHIHSKGIIHRDIAPDNIILRDRDRLPVLIDFGVVKELATRFQSPGTVFQGSLDPNTTVGKIGYAPPEQMQTGRSYASSDLYSLAVTAVVLLTGREPQELFDDVTLTWYWQRWVSVEPDFAQVLNQMLSYRPGDRYQTANEVIQAMQSPGSMMVPATYAPPVSPPSYPSPDSRAATMAVGRGADLSRVSDTRPVSAAASRSSIWDDPLAVVALGLGLVMLTGIASWAIVRSVLNPNQLSTFPSTSPTQTAPLSPSPSTSASQSPRPRPTSTDPVTFTQRLDVAPDTKVIQNGTLRANETVNYVVSGEEGAQLSALIGGEGVVMSVLGRDRQPLGRDTQQVSYWQGTLPYSGDYYIQLKPVNGLRRSKYQLEVSVKRSAESPSPDPQPPFPSPEPAPVVDTERIQFASGDMGATVSDRTTPNVIKRYLLNAREGQILNVRVNGGAVALTIRYPNGRVVDNASNVPEWESPLPRSGDYMIDVVAFQNTRFEVDVTVRDPVRGDDGQYGNGRYSDGRLSRRTYWNRRPAYQSRDETGDRPRRSRQPQNSDQEPRRNRRNWGDADHPRYRQPQNPDQPSPQPQPDTDSPRQPQTSPQPSPQPQGEGNASQPPASPGGKEYGGQG